MLLLAGAIVAAPGARSAIARWFGLEGVVVKRVKVLPPTTLGRDLALGTRVSLAVARERAGFELRRPAALGAPGEVYADRDAVTLVYPGPGSKPLLFTQVRGSAAPYVQKFVDRRTERVDIAGARGLLLRGRHVVLFSRGGGAELQASPSRLAGTTVLWERDGLLLRLEGDRPAPELLRIARSVP